MRKPVLHSALIAGALVTGLIAAPMAATAEVEVPQGLSITIDDGVDEVGADETIDYETTIGNTGADPVEVTVVVTVPGYADITDAGEASVDGVSATWTTTVEPQEPQTLTVSVKVGEIPETEYRVTTLASVYLGDEAEGSPLIRSADANKIPGVEDPVVETDKPAESEDEGEFPLLAVIIGIVVLALLVATALVIWTVRRKKRAADEGPAVSRSGAAAPEALADKTDAETPVVVAPAVGASAVVVPPVVEEPVVEDDSVIDEPTDEAEPDEAESVEAEPVELEPIEDAVAQAEDAAVQAERAIAQVEESAESEIVEASEASAPASDAPTDGGDGGPSLRRDLRRD